MATNETQTPAEQTVAIKPAAQPKNIGTFKMTRDVKVEYKTK